MSKGAFTLRDLSGPYVEVACTKCERRGKLYRDRLIKEHGDSIALPDLRTKLATNCPRQGNMWDSCGAYYVELKPAD
jgi:hypothetical protein